jgi:hypothetical protein
MKIVTALALLCLMATAAHAGEPWPENICRVLAGYEQKDIRLSENAPKKLAYARSNVLHMLRNHCGVDISAKEAADVAAVSAAVSGSSQVSSGGDSGGDHGVDFEVDFTKRSPTHCTTMALGGGLSTTDCD